MSLQTVVKGEGKKATHSGDLRAGAEHPQRSESGRSESGERSFALQDCSMLLLPRHMPGPHLHF